MGLQLSKDSHDETRSSSSGSSSSYKLFGKRSTRPALFKTGSGSSSNDHENNARAAALKAFKDKQALKQQKKLARLQQQQQHKQKHYHSSSTTTSSTSHSQHQQPSTRATTTSSSTTTHASMQQQQHPLPPPPHQPTRRLSHSTDSISSSGKGSINTHQSSGRSGSSFHDMTLDERLGLLNLTGGRGLPSVEGTYYGHINFVGDEQEINRQLRYHYVLKQVLGGNLKVELDSPEMILDSACGAGFWSLDIGQQFPDCQVVAMDIALPEDIHLRQQQNDSFTSKTGNGKVVSGLAADGVPNVTYIHGDILSLPLQFGDNTFDFIYQRELGYVIPQNHWSPLIHDFYRLLKPEGMLQLVEYPLEFPTCGPLSDIVNNWIQTETAANGLNSRFVDMFEQYLDDAGFDEVTTHIFEFPIGEWPTDERERQQGFLQKELSRMLLKQSKPFLSKALDMESDVYDQFVAAVMNEFEENHGTTVWKIVTAKKKGLPEKNFE